MARKPSVSPDPLSAELAPVQRYAEHIHAVTGKTHIVITIPEGTQAHSMGYRFATCEESELPYYTERGATVVNNNSEEKQQ